MSEVKHSETPWSVGQSAPGFTDIMRYGGKILVATAYECGQQHKIDAAHLVHCVNSHDALVAEVERLREENAAFKGAMLPLGLLPEGPWEVWNSCSFRRITGPDGRDGGVLSGIKQRDGHLDLSMPEDKLRALCELVNGCRAVLSDTTGGE